MEKRLVLMVCVLGLALPSLANPRHRQQGGLIRRAERSPGGNGSGFNLREFLNPPSSSNARSESKAKASAKEEDENPFGSFTPVTAKRDIGANVHVYVPKDHVEPFIVHFGNQKCLASGKGGYQQKRESVGRTVDNKRIKYHRVEWPSRGTAYLDRGKSKGFKEKNSVYGSKHPPAWFFGQIQLHTLRNLKDDMSLSNFQCHVFSKGCMITTPSCISAFNRFLKRNGAEVPWSRKDPPYDWDAI